MKNIVKASGFSLPVLHKGLTPRYLQRLPLSGVAFPNPRPPGSRAGLKDIRHKIERGWGLSLFSDSYF